MPIDSLMALTIPASQRPYFAKDKKTQIKWTSLQFFMCIVWIGIYTYIMVWMSVYVGKTFGIPPPIMGLTLLAGGTSLPDTMASIAVAKKGQGTMAVANAVGSNVFDICVALAFPWLLKSIVLNETSKIYSDNISIMVFTLFLTVILVVMSINFSNWKLTLKTGYVLMFAYLIFVLESLALEYNWFNTSEECT